MLSHVPIAVIGGGITGQMVQWAIPSAEIYDWKPTPKGPLKLTRNLGGNYLWEPVAGVSCRKFPVITEIDGRPPTPESIAAYKTKIGKEGEDPSNWPLQFRHEMWGYEFTEMPPARVTYEHRIVEINHHDRRMVFGNGRLVTYDLLVSTIPLYSLLSQLGIGEPPGRLRFQPIHVKLGARPPDAPYPLDVFYVNYISNPRVYPYRFTDRDGERHYEALGPMDNVPSKRILPGKIHDHPSVPELLERLQGFGIQTFGRYGSWNSNELVHETWWRILQWKEDMGL